MKHKLRIILTRLLIVLVTAVIIFGVWDFSRDRRNSQSLTEFLQRIDSLLAEGRDSEAADLLERPPGERFSSYQYLLIAKRMWRLGNEEVRYRLVAELTARAVDEYPGNQDIAAIRSYALLKIGRPEQAYRVSREKLTDDRYLGLIAQAAIASTASLTEDFFERAQESSYRYAGLLLLIDAEPSAESYASAGSLWRIEEFSADAALIYARRGELERANELLRRSAYLSFPALELQIAYDAGDPAHGLAAIDVLQSENPLYSLYRADLLYKLGRKEGARELYRRIISSQPDYSLIPYLNLAALSAEDPLGILQQARTVFPESVELLERLGETYYRRGDNLEAAEVFDQVLKLDSTRSAVRVRLIESRRGSGAMGDLSRLWEAYHQADEKDTFASQLAWRLYGERDRAGLELLVRLQQDIPDGEVAFPQALFYTLSGDYLTAAESFASLYRSRPDWRYAHNSGLLYRYAGRYEESIDQFQLADEILTRGGAELIARERSLVWLGLGETQLELGEVKNASQSIDFALDLDPDNLRAGLLQANMNP